MPHEDPYTPNRDVSAKKSFEQNVDAIYLKKDTSVGVFSSGIMLLIFQEMRR